MKKCLLFLIVAVIASLVLPACSTQTYEDGYREGYQDARFEIESEYDLYVAERYLEGYSDGYSRIKDSFSDAEYYACDHSVYHPEEAMWIIDTYESCEPYWRNGAPITEQEYMDAVKSLYYFYEYYFNGEFSHYQDP